MRSTTENVAGIAASARALRMTLDKEALALPKIAKMKQVIQEALEEFDGVQLFTEEEGFAPNIITFGIRGVRG